MKIPHILWLVMVAALPAGALSSRLAADTVTILSTDFSTLVAGTNFNDNDVIGGTPATNSLVAKRTAGQTYVKVAGGGGALQLTRNGGFTLGFFKAISDGASFAQINGSMTFSLLDNGVSSRPDLAFGLNSNTAFAGTGAANTSMQFTVNSAGKLTYINGSTTTTAATLSNDVYRIEFSVDYTSTTQDTWSFTLYDVTADNSVVATASAIDTRAANIVPGSFVANATGGGSSANPFFQVSQITLEGVTAASIPEPSSYAILAGGLLFAFCLLARRRR